MLRPNSSSITEIRVMPASESQLAIEPTLTEAISCGFSSGKTTAKQLAKRPSISAIRRFLYHMTRRGAVLHELSAGQPAVRLCWRVAYLLQEILHGSVARSGQKVKLQFLHIQ